jgi:hypothetical protein
VPGYGRGIDAELVQDGDQVIGVGLDADAVGQRGPARAGAVDPDDFKPVG